MANGKRPAPRPRRSAFTAAFLSFLFPGLGHVYLGRWLRAALWAIPPFLAIAAVAGLALGPNRTQVLANLVDPDVLLAVLGIILIDLLYRLAALVDAWRLARVPRVGSAGARMLSTAGLAAVMIVLVASHVAVAQPVLFVYDSISSFDGEGGDITPIPTIEDLGPEWAAILRASTLATDDGATVSTEPEIPEEYEWDGKKRLDILLVGIDSGRRGSSTFLTDTVMVVSVDPKSGQLAMISLPRDTAGVPLPRKWTAARSVYGSTYDSKINTLYTTARLREDLFPGNDRQRGYKALMGALSELYGIDIKYYVSVDLRGFRGAVNAIGGIVVDVRTPLLEDGYPTDDGRGKLRLYFPAGLQTMNGQKALAFARSRKSTSDFARAERQQLLVAAVRDQLDIGALLAPGVIEKLTKEVKTHVKTNIPARMIPKLLALASDVKLKGRKSLVLSNVRGFSTECNRCQADGLYKLLPNVPKIRAAVKGVFDRKTKAGQQATTTP
jgi:LCP family protein required for cell wall assembly